MCNKYADKGTYLIFDLIYFQRSISKLLLSYFYSFKWSEYVFSHFYSEINEEKTCASHQVII